MIKIVLLCLSIVLLWSEDKVDALTIIQKSDKVRNAGRSFYQQCSITEYVDAKKTDAMLVSIYSKIEENSGQYRTLVRIQKPKKDKNKLIMRNGNILWFYDPNSKASMQISPQQRLLGQSSNGDVMASNFALDYEVELKETQRIKGGDKKEHDCYRLELKAINNDVSYPLVEYWVEKETFYPIEAKFYTKSKKLLKDVYFRKYKEVLGVVRPTEVLIFNGFDRSRATKMSFGKVKEMEIPNFWFSRDYLVKFDGE